MSDDNIYYNFDEFIELMNKTTDSLRKMNAMQAHMRWQFGEPPEWEQFVKEMDETNGWVSSHC